MLCVAEFSPLEELVFLLRSEGEPVASVPRRCLCRAERSGGEGVKGALLARQVGRTEEVAAGAPAAGSRALGLSPLRAGPCWEMEPEERQLSERPERGSVSRYLISQHCSLTALVLRGSICCLRGFNRKVIRKIDPPNHRRAAQGNP